MIHLRIAEACRAKGIRHPLTALTKAGISITKATQYLKGKTNRLMIDDAERLCRLLRCTINDLLEWTPDNQAEDYPENPLQAIRKRKVLNLEERLKNLSMEEIERRLAE